MKANKLLILLFFVLLVNSTSFGQSCNCATAFKWTITAFEQNDAGFQYIIDQKGREAYEAHTEIFRKKVGEITNADTCVLAMRQWAKFFRVGHFGFIVNQNESVKSGDLQSKKTTATKKSGSNSHVQYQPYLRDYDSTTVYLRLPTFDSRYKKEIDSIVNANSNKIRSRKNLIIDIQDNGGGDDASFNEIIPILYTNPIRDVSVARLSTPNNNKFWQEYLSRKDLSASDKAIYTGYIDKLNANLGKFVMLHDSVYTSHYDRKYPLPQNVAIIINEKNGSTAEQFLLAAKQSKKVKLFGVTTMGELDISNMHSITSPDEKYTLWYCMSKSLRIPENTIDNKGIAPDFFIDRSIPKEKWLPYVSGIMKEW